MYLYVCVYQREDELRGKMVIFHLSNTRRGNFFRLHQILMSQQVT